MDDKKPLATLIVESHKDVNKDSIQIIGDDGQLAGALSMMVQENKTMAEIIAFCYPFAIASHDCEETQRLGESACLQWGPKTEAFIKDRNSDKVYATMACIATDKGSLLDIEGDLRQLISVFIDRSSRDPRLGSIVMSAAASLAARFTKIRSALEKLISELNAGTAPDEIQVMMDKEFSDFSGQATYH